MNYRELFGVKPGSNIRLAEVDPDFTDDQEDKKSAAAEVADDLERLRKLQYLLYAEHKRALLIILQGVDASGKDGTVSHVFSGINPQGAYVHSFKEPTREELDHDFLWRVHRQTPGKGELAIFNRSQYEDVLIVRVHDLVPQDAWEKRYALINDFEKNLALANTTILKFYLHISEEEQLRRFKDRLDDPDRQWKISDADYTERSYFQEYMRAYEDVLNKTSTEYAPWFVIPSNHKWFRNLAVSRIVVETLESLHMTFPQPSVDIDEIRERYHAAKLAEKNHST